MAKQSLKFSFITQNLRKLISPLKENQEFLRLLYYMSDSPLDSATYDINGNTVSQPDIVMANGLKLIEDKKIILTLFNESILTEEEVMIFFSHVKSRFNDDISPLSDTIYQMDIIVPYKKIFLNTGEQRQIQMASQVCKEIDQQDIAGIGKVYCVDSGEYKVNDKYQGISLVFKIKDTMRVVK